MDPTLIRQNPWWAEGFAALAGDPKIRAVRESPVSWDPETHPFEYSRDLVYTLRGPRQVGKSTLLKLIVERALREGRPPRRILYLDVERAGVTAYSQLTDLLEGYLDWIALEGGEARGMLLLDEVTGVPRWSTAIRVLVDADRLRGFTVLATGSNAKDVKGDTDRMPGRRGPAHALDYLLFPLSFPEYVRVVRPEAGGRLPSLEPEEAMEPRVSQEAAREAQVRMPDLPALFLRYLSSGGFFLAVAAETRAGEIPEYIYAIYRNALLGEATRMGRRESVLRAIVATLHGHLGEEFQWRALARDSGAGTHETVRDTVEDLEAAFAWHVYWRVKEPGGCRPALRSPKKLYPLDPFIWHTLAAWSRGAARGWAEIARTLADPAATGRLVESVTADHLRRLFGPYAYYHRTKGGEEIDFVTCREGAVASRVEVKYRKTIARGDYAPLARHGGGILLSRHTLEWHPEENVAVVPVPLALAVWPVPTLFRGQP